MNVKVFLYLKNAGKKIGPPHHNTTIKMKEGTTKGEILKRGRFCKNNSLENNSCSSFQKTSFCFFSVILRIQMFVLMVVFMNSILNLI